MSETTQRNRRKAVVGRVTSDKMAKTIVVEAERMVEHPHFRKYIKRSTTYKAHDENEEARVGDVVELMECRPLSKTKYFRLTRIVRRGKAHAAEQGGES